jgi:hypothetical protein
MNGYSFSLLKLQIRSWTRQRPSSKVVQKLVYFRTRDVLWSFKLDVVGLLELALQP